MTNNTSNDSLSRATRSRLKFSGHGKALGAAGTRELSLDPDNCEHLQEPGQSVAISPQDEAFEPILIGVEWDNIQTKNAGFFKKMLKKATKSGVDLDIGCLYELKDGRRGALQAFGEKFGSFDKEPYIQLSGDERTGDAEGHDESLLVNGHHWNDINRILVYIYIYGGVALWRDLNPRVIIDIPGENDLVVTLKNHNDELDLCAIGELENVRGGIKLTNRTEYFPGHEEMDRAFGYGLEWGDGSKDE